jgi:hypothetical protein
MNARIFVCSILLAGAVSTTAAGCTSSSKPRPSPEKVIAANWTAFFGASTPVTQRINLLQNGSEFASIVQDQAASAQASETSAQVTKVMAVTSSQATVIFTLLTPTAELSGLRGDAVYQNGTWKVAARSFCGLLAVENGGKRSSLPTACKSVL